MANKKMIAMLAGLMALTVSGGSFAAYAADNGIANTTNQADYSYVTGQENGVQYADAEGVDEDADKSDFSFNKGQARAESYRQDSGDDGITSKK